MSRICETRNMGVFIGWSMEIQSISRRRYPSSGPEQLVAALKRDNLFWRRHAQRLLVERGKTDVVPALLKLAGDSSVDEIGLNVGAIHALWTLHGLGVVNEEHADVLAAVRAALKHPSAGVRRNAVQVLPSTAASAEAIVAAGLTNDEDSQVKLAAILALADMPATPAAGKQVAQVAAGAEAMSDRWLADAVTSAAAVQAFGFLQELKATATKAADMPAGAPVWGVVARVAEHIARGRPDATQVEQLLDVLDSAPTPMVESLVGGLSRGWPRDYSVNLSPATEAKLLAMFNKAPTGSKGQLVRLAGCMGE